ncbi:MAG: lactate utilization protein [Theionarchaea archaeon]|nr:lactate utilization protein [Theionarchaea archaeon]MBU7036521.1 lactate utilization protein [Theionarchaea archaeon]
MTENILKETAHALRQHGFNTQIVSTREEACAAILSHIPLNSLVGIGDSATVRQIGIIEALHTRGTSIINPFRGKFRRETAVASLLADIFLTGINAVTTEGSLVDVDGAGNRIAGTIFGPPEVLVVAGQNKIVKNVNEAVERLKTVIAPRHAAGMGYSLPCTQIGTCQDCNSPKRICRIEAVIRRAPMYTQTTVLLVGEDLGLSWDPHWAPERIRKIHTQYLSHVWNPAAQEPF